MRGLVRVGAAVPSLALGNVKENMKRHLAMMREAKEKHVSIVTFPELSLTGYTCGDLFFQRRLLDGVTDALLALKDEMPEGILAVVGAPLEIEGALYNCAVVLHKGEIISAVPKTFLPNNGEFYEKRWFQSGDARTGAVRYSRRGKPTAVDAGRNMEDDGENRRILLSGRWCG